MHHGKHTPLRFAPYDLLLYWWCIALVELYTGDVRFAWCVFALQWIIPWSRTVRTSAIHHSSGFFLVLKQTAAFFCNPYQCSHGLMQIFGEIVNSVHYAIVALRRSPDASAAHFTFQLPGHGAWCIHRGGVTPSTSHSWYILNQRFAYDLLRIDDSGRSFCGDGLCNTDYYAFGAPIAAPAAGRIIRCRDDIRDNTRMQTTPFWARSLLGNYIMIEHEPGVISVIAHLQHQSITVHEGDHVNVGETIARCGNSGNSTEPHIHWHVQNSRIPYWGLSLPIRMAQIKHSPLPTTQSDNAAPIPLMQDHLSGPQLVSNSPY